MNSTTQMISHFFLLSLAFGTQLFSPVVNTRLTGVGFYKLCTSIVLGGLILALGIDAQMKPDLGLGETCLYIFLLLSNILSFFFHKDEKTWVMWLLYLFQIIFFSTLSFISFNFNPIWNQLFFTSMTLLGLSNFSMLLGHYYLVVPKLSEEPLIYCLYLFWIILFIKIVFFFTTIFSTGRPFLLEETVLGEGYVFNWLFIGMRFLWGYLAPLILSLFTFRLCKMRSIQSATGVLYIMEFFVIVGELISAYFMAKHGLPL